MDSAMLRRLTYSRGDICDRTINTTYLEQDCPLDQFSPKTPDLLTTASLGHLNLPLEIFENIFSHLSLETLTLLRSVSKRLTLTIDSLPAYRKIITYAPHALRALLGTLTARYFTANDLFTALRSPRCFHCTRFGPYLSLLTCHRICWTCLSTLPVPISLACAKRLFHFSPLHSPTPILLSLPGFYSLKKHNCPAQKEPSGGLRVQLVAYTAVAPDSAGESIYEKAKRQTAFALRDPRYGSVPDLDIMQTDPVGHAAGYAREPQRFMAAVRFPTLDNGRIDWGLSCMICLERAKEGDEERFWNEVYSEEEVKAHVEGCVRREEARRRKVYGRRVLERRRVGKSVHGSAE